MLLTLSPLLFQLTTLTSAGEDQVRDDGHAVVPQSGGEDVSGEESGAQVHPGQPREVRAVCRTAMDCIVLLWVLLNWVVLNRSILQWVVLYHNVLH